MKHSVIRIAALVLVLALAAGMLTACGGSDKAAYTAGTYTGTAKGYGGDVTVTITVDASSITDVKVEGADETPEVGGAALDSLAQAIKDAGSAEIDGVAGATVTSDAVKAAAADALAQAKA